MNDDVSNDDPELLDDDASSDLRNAGDDHEGESSGRVTRVRPTPAGLPRRDRRAWRALELERFQRETAAAAAAALSEQTGWGQGFMTNPPRGLGRRGRRAWLTAQREETKQWWDQRRVSNTDIDARAVGVLVIALVCCAGLLWSTLTTDRIHPDPDTPAIATVPMATPTAVSGLAELPVPVLPVATSSTAAIDPAGQLTGAAPVAPRSMAPLAGGWQPAPAGGVPPMLSVTPTPIDPGNVVLQHAPTGPVRPTEVATPIAAVTAWLARTCPSTWTDPFGTEIRRGHGLMTTAGWASADPARDVTGQRLWTAVVIPARQTRVCGDFDVHQSADASAARGVAYVGYIADRVVNNPGKRSVVEHLVGARIVVQQSDGRWLVDRPVVGG
jgi:hypothetical protein